MVRSFECFLANRGFKTSKAQFLAGLIFSPLRLSCNLFLFTILQEHLALSQRPEIATTPKAMFNGTDIIKNWGRDFKILRTPKIRLSPCAWKKHVFEFWPWSRYRRCYPRVGKNAFVECRRYVVMFRYSPYRHKFPDMSKKMTCRYLFQFHFVSEVVGSNPVSFDHNYSCLLISWLATQESKLFSTRRLLVQVLA